MPTLTLFEVERGAVVSDCMDETQEFISGNLRYLHELLTPIKSEIGQSSDFTFICYEEDWSFAAKIEKVELSRVSKGNGLILEGGQCAYDLILEEIDS